MSGLQRGIVLAVVGCLLGGAATAIADDTPSPEALKNMYQTLKRDQDRISQLAHDNEQLQAKVKELQKDLAAAQSDNAALKRQQIDDADKAFYLRSFHAAWKGFIDLYPDVGARWKAFMSDDQFSGPETNSFIDPNWPLSARG